MTGPRGWCPGILKPMEVEDGLLVRLRPRLGRLSGRQVEGIVLAANRHGNGEIELTNRANLQIRGLTVRGHEALLAAFEKLDLLDPDRETETRRNILVTPFWRHGDATERLHDALILRLFDLPTLPQKFGFVLDTGAAPCLTDVPGDIRVERNSEGLVLRPDRMKAGERATEETAVDRIIDLAKRFAQVRRADERRMRDVTARHGFTLTDPATPHVSRPPHHPLVTLPKGPFPAARLLAAFGDAPEMRLTPWRAIYLPQTSLAET